MNAKDTTANGMIYVARDYRTEQAH